MTPCLRVGRKGQITDNAGNGGILACIHPKDGIVYTDGADEYGRFFSIHPDSKIRFKGWQVPRWDELRALVRDIHTTTMKHHTYIAWDFALTERGWDLIEGNWGQNITQYADQKEIKRQFLEYINIRK